MNERFRIYAAVALTGLLIVGAGLLFLGRSSASSAASVHQIKPLHPRSKAKVALAPPKVKLAKTKTRKAGVRRSALIAGVPTPLAHALKSHAVVVLALVTPDSEVDNLTLAEARAGAATAHVGFARVSVTNNAQVEALSALIGTNADAQNRLLDAPSVLVFQRPRTLFVRLNGYVDEDTVEQAAVNAAPAS
jgi:hypothetical protein